MNITQTIIESVFLVIGIVIGYHLSPVTIEETKQMISKRVKLRGVEVGAVKPLSFDEQLKRSNKKSMEEEKVMEETFDKLLPH